MQAKSLPETFNPNFFDALASHFIQSWRWGVVRKETGIPVVRLAFMEATTLKNVAQITLHKVPTTSYSLGLLSKCAPYTNEELDELVKIGKENKCFAIRLEPNVLVGDWQPNYPKLKKAPRNYYIPYNYLIDLTKTEAELLAAMEGKTRYNIKVAQKHGVIIEEHTDYQTLDDFIALQKETAARQKFYLHPDSYYRTVFKVFAPTQNVKLLVAKAPSGQILSIWFLMIFKKTITYLYGASSQAHKEMMANNLMAWQAIKLSKQLGLNEFDFGGTLGEDADPNDPRFGFHKFKRGFGGQHVSCVGTYDLVINQVFYTLFTTVDTLRWRILRLIKH